MKYDIILAGVGGQGVLSVSAIIASSAMKEGLLVKQSEVHGMSQRGGAVLANLRLADAPIASDLIPLGAAALILSMEPLESLRYLRVPLARRRPRHLDRTRSSTSRTTPTSTALLAHDPRAARAPRWSTASSSRARPGRPGRRTW